MRESAGEWDGFVQRRKTRLYSLQEAVLCRPSGPDIHVRLLALLTLLGLKRDFLLLLGLLYGLLALLYLDLEGCPAPVSRPPNGSVITDANAPCGQQQPTRAYKAEFGSMSSMRGHGGVEGLDALVVLSAELGALLHQWLNLGVDLISLFVKLLDGVRAVALATVHLLQNLCSSVKPPHETARSIRTYLVLHIHFLLLGVQLIALDLKLVLDVLLLQLQSLE